MLHWENVPADAAYAALVGGIVDGVGARVRSRGSWARRVIGPSAAFDSFPLVSARRTAWKTSIREMEFFLCGSTNVNDAHPSVRGWWRPWAGPGGEIPGGYGRQLRHFNGWFDQVRHLIGGVCRDPHSRRNCLTTWHPSDMADPATPIANCHLSFAGVSVEGGRLSLFAVQRSADVVVGLPHNWCQAWALMLWLAHRTGHEPGRLHWVGFDAHVYEAHLALARRIALWEGVPCRARLVYTPTSEEFLADDFSLDGEYRPWIDEPAEMVV